MNKISISGKIVKGPKLSKLGKDKSVVNLTILNKEKIVTGDGDEKEVQLYMSCEAWNEVARDIKDQLELYDMVEVDGRIIFSTWSSGDKKFSSTKTSISNFKKIGSPDKPEEVEDFESTATTNKEVPF